MSITFFRDEGDDEINMSNANALAIMRAAGIEPDYCGTIQVGSIPNVLQSIMRRVNGDVSRYTRETVDEQGPGQARMISMGIDEDYVVNRLRQLQGLLMRARSAGQDVNWG